MKVFIAGATGAIGRPLVSALAAAGHEVMGMTSSERGLSVLRERGVEGVLADALDADAVRGAVARFKPHAIIDELTSLPKNYTPDEMRAAADRDRAVRIEGGRNLLNAAHDAGVRRYVVQSTGFFYRPGTGLAAEEEQFAVDATPAIAGASRTYAQIEERVFSQPGIEGVALRYGFFYGPGTYQDPENGSVSRQVRARQYPIIGGGQGVYSFVHVWDAAVATVAALEAEPGPYNIVDDHPAEMAVWLPALARFLGAPEPPWIGEQDALEAAGPDAVYYATRLRGAANGRAKERLGFAPRRLEWLAQTRTAQP